MSLFRSRTLFLVLGLGLMSLALRPFPPADRVLSLFLVPCRFLAELVVPVEWLQTRRALASVSHLSVDAGAESARHDALERMVRASALPERFTLPDGAAAVHGEVLGRDPRDLDRVRLRVMGCRGLVAGLPVVSGDWFVGVVQSVREPADGTASEVWVKLITDQNERIAARVEAAEGGAACRLVAGGLAPRADTVHLDVHNPSRRDVRSGRVLVDERPQVGGRYTGFANGSWLGELVSEQVGGKEVLGIRPGLDYGSGLYQVLVLFPEGLVQTVERDSTPILDDGRWAFARRFLSGEPSPWRNGVAISLGLGDGVRPGAAVAAGVRLCGRVGSVGVLQSSVSELGDPGLAIAALAVVGGGAGRDPLVPFVMGRIESRGRLDDGTLLFHWEATVPIGGAAGDAPVPAEVWTGSGEAGVPRGLWVGTTDLPRGPGPHLLQVRAPAAMARAGGWRVRTAGPGGRGGGVR